MRANKESHFTIIGARLPVSVPPSSPSRAPYADAISLPVSPRLSSGTVSRAPSISIHPTYLFIFAFRSSFPFPPRRCPGFPRFHYARSRNVCLRCSFPLGISLLPVGENYLNYTGNLYERHALRGEHPVRWGRGDGGGRRKKKKKPAEVDATDVSPSRNASQPADPTEK